MSPCEFTTQNFRNVNGKIVYLDVNNEKEKVLKIVVNASDKIHVTKEIVKFFIFLVTCFLLNHFVYIFILSMLLVWHYVNLATIVITDSILVVESVGVQILSKRRFFGLHATEFLPWNIIQDIFINEVIIERRVLYYLTFIVKNENDDSNPVRLVPLFRNTRPEKKCLEFIYHQLAVFIKPGKKS
ncbi:phosphatidylinositol N-acetylglucosaminyltransferase subunit H-like [Leptopilina boulardi]|uniref:phosphatidylinositol N-acetylglucosaminyltransferase subunit H-like n=1 Tax=Leptopilina boulardi TaxID=63433 RepID=UPI0021F58557|nr:phosphatidylinositol N-acetylglucosaminyltransferase subunit H-like [Leptopilina boulardi]